ncbi:aminotransferase class I/II-fold pyridoxal phosphate-dependent enzyme [uncultured Roseobacter sp.]|uniref:MalY/PatB family protein n=1 Tax=uncultured Roseobacter sp. TaxID=114847 RepID=UPI00261E9ADA|nr:aminotransferase class I/II-fold pyridoxal phosphate-dependent enzyme [uncultured Roseobacter sp.]
MTLFDIAPAKTGDTFVRHDPKFLDMVFGTDQVTPLWVADMDFAVAAPIQEELSRLADRGQFAYEFNSKGVFAAISDWFRRRHDLILDVEKFEQIPGVLSAIALLIRELTEPGDSVLMQVPAYHQFAKVISTAGRKIVKSPLRNIDGAYEMDYADLEEKLSAADVKAMILCNPHNPVGRVWRRDELEKLVEVANRHNVTIISDEIHSDIIYTGHRFTSLMAVDPKIHVSVIGSPAKTFGMHSISNGYIYTANEELLDRFKKTAESMYLTHGNAFTTFATIAAYEKGDVWVDELLTYLEATAAWIDQFLEEELPAVKMSPVEGTYQVWLDCSATGLAGDDLKATLGQSGFGATPGTWFDQDATQFIRVNIAAPRAEIEKAFSQFKSVLDRAMDARAQGIAPAGSKACAGASTNSCC